MKKKCEFRPNGSQNPLELFAFISFSSFTFRNKKIKPIASDKKKVYHVE